MSDDMVTRLRTLASEAAAKGATLQGIPELRLVGNAYVGMSERIVKILDEAVNEKEDVRTAMEREVEHRRIIGLGWETWD